MVGSHVVGVGGGVCTTGGGFNPQPGFTYSGTIADGSTFTITSNSAVLGSKPVDPRPLMFIDPAATGNLNPSTLGRSSTLYFNANMSYVSTGGPTGGGWAQGAPVVSGDTGTQKTWTLACDIDQWGAGSPIINAYGAQYYLWRTRYQNFGEYTDVANNANVKIVRCWGRLPNTPGGTEAYPDWYMSASNGRLTAENCSSATPNPDFPRGGQGSGSTDQNALDNIWSFNGGLPGSPNAVTFQNWFSEEIITEANQGDPGTTPPTPDNTSFSFNWRVEGLNSNQAAFPTPVDTYQWNQWYINSAACVSLASAAQGSAVSGNMMRYYFWHYIVDGTSGRFMVPVGSYVGYGATLLDDSWCRVHMRNNATFSAYTVTEVQPTSAWSTSPTNSVSVTLRRGRFSSYSGNALIITDSTGTEHFVGTFT